MIKKFETSYNSGSLDELKSSIFPFLASHKTELRNFIDHFNSNNDGQSLDSLIKFFLISMNMPVNFKFYLDSQSKAMENEIGPEFKNEEKRTKLVTSWIGANAEDYRTFSIMEQIYCFERAKTELLPQIEKLLSTSE